jgi:ATP-dependent RNA helicase DOB1
MTFITDESRKKVKEFKKRALDRLEEEDRKLPQIVSLCNLIDKGIGFHHAGMIPILKEMIEILFTDGYL